MTVLYFLGKLFVVNRPLFCHTSDILMIKKHDYNVVKSPDCQQHPVCYKINDRIVEFNTYSVI